MAHMATNKVTRNKFGVVLGFMLKKKDKKGSMFKERVPVGPKREVY